MTETENLSKFIRGRSMVIVEFDPPSNYMTYAEWMRYAVEYGIAVFHVGEPEYIHSLVHSASGFRAKAQASHADFGTLAIAEGMCLDDDSFWQGKKPKTQPLMSCAKTRAAREALRLSMPFITVGRIEEPKAVQVVKAELPANVRAFGADG